MTSNATDDVAPPLDGVVRQHPAHVDKQPKGTEMDSNTKHTPGPWQVLPEECEKPYIRVRGSVLGGRYKIANVVTPIYEGVHLREAEETRRNARLIAAAPQQHDALLAVSYAPGFHLLDEATKNAVLAALAAVGDAERCN